MCCWALDCNFRLVREDKVRAMWNAAPKDDSGVIERLKCWDFILGDDELCAMYGADVSAGKEWVYQAST